MDKRLAALLQRGPWKGEVGTRWWSLKPDDLEAVAVAVKRNALPGEIAALLDVPKLTHPKAVKALSLLRQAGMDVDGWVAARDKQQVANVAA